MKFLLLIVTLSCLLINCKVLEPQEVVNDDIIFRDFYCFKDLELIKSLGYKTNGEFFEKISYRKRIKNVTDIKQKELIKIKQEIRKFSESNLVYVLCQDTCATDYDEIDDFNDNYDNDLLYILVLIPDE